MSFRSKRPPEAAPLPVQPPAPELMDIIDEISGVQTITVTDKNGKKRRVTQKLPLTNQEKQILNQAENLIAQSLDNIQRLYKYDPSFVVNYQPFIQAFSSINEERMRDLSQIGSFRGIAEQVQQFRTMSKDLAIREFDIKTREAENTLARRGLSRSSEATELRSTMAKDRALLEQQLDVNANNYSQDLKNRELDTQTRLFNLQEAGRQGRLAEAETGFELEKQKLADIEAARQGAINENATLMEIGQGIKSGDIQKSNAALANSQNALGIFNSQAHNSNQRYANEISRVTNQYKMDVDKFNSTPATFGQRLTDLGFATVGNQVGARIGSSLSNLNKGPEVPGVAPNFGKDTKRKQAFKQLAAVGR